ncbi:unnamed protein product, partial [Rotaria sp. Silwood2]
EDERNAERNSYVAESQSSPDGLLTDILVNKPICASPAGPDAAGGGCTILNWNTHISSSWRLHQYHRQQRTLKQAIF